jgi:GT2 family glycosyltransferase
MINKPRVAAVLLNYNSEEDLFVSAEQLKRQTNVDLTMIIVDNASSLESIAKIKAWSKIFDSNNISGTSNDVFELIQKDLINSNSVSTFIIYNNENKGYSAGNNIGIKFADHLDVDSVLIVNPDMRFKDENYVYELVKTLFSDKKYFVASSKIVGLDGKDQSPSREPSFLEELLWPRVFFPKIFKNTDYIISYDKNKIQSVPKIIGSCLLLKMDFVRDIGYFDENTFLYSEEPILAAQIKEKKGKIAFNPFIEAVHAHKRSEKANNSKRMLLFIKSRKYYLKNYSGYNRLQLALLDLSYAVLAILHKIKYRFSQ